jgi:hypothetical protein
MTLVGLSAKLITRGGEQDRDVGAQPLDRAAWPRTAVPAETLEQPQTLATTAMPTESGPAVCRSNHSAASSGMGEETDHRAEVELDKDPAERERRIAQPEEDAAQGGEDEQQRSIDVSALLRQDRLDCGARHPDTAPTYSRRWRCRTTRRGS